MPNRLAHEKSPYLLQHAENPVDWFPWGEEAFAKARKEHKPIFLSIGYSTCYWCHVMEKDSFEKEDVARALEPFVCIKVDREEHPEVDEIYMDAVVAMTGHGGWPMSVFLTPELQPFWGGTYIPHDNFLQLLDKIATFWREQRHQLQNGGKSVVAALQEREQKRSGAGEQLTDVQVFARFEEQCATNFDEIHGGFGGAPKFPSSMALRMLLRLGGDRNLAMVERSLEAMACGGIFDQLGGGFHRYATDDRWLVPHFEKMLYDNALLAVTYVEAFQVTGKAFYAGVARATLDYLLRDLRHPGGAFYSAEDAGEVGKEGEFYVWKFDEIAAALEGGGLDDFRRIYPISQAGNFEHGQNILHLANAGDWAAAESEELKGLRLRLWEERETRARPHRDEKILTSWNGLAIAALAFAGAALEEPRYVEAAAKAAGWIREHLTRSGGLLRRWAGGEARFAGNAADYVYLIDGLIHLYQATFDASWLHWARELQRRLDRDFWDEAEGGYFTASHDEANLVIRKKDRSDGALPSPNSVGCRNLIRLAEYFVDPALGARADALLHFQRPLLARSPFGLAACAQALFLHASPSLLVIAGRDQGQCEALAKRLRRGFHPRLSLAWAGASGPNEAGQAASGRGLEPGQPLPVTEGRTSREDCVGYLCQDKTCLPAMPAAEVLAELGG